MPTPTFAEFKAEQSEADRRKFLALLAPLESAAETYVKGLQNRIDADQETIDRLIEEQKQRKLDTAEVVINIAEYVKQIAVVADQDVITNADLTTLQKSLVDAKLTAKQRESRDTAATKTKVPLDDLNQWQLDYNDRRALGYTDTQARIFADKMADKMRGR